MDGGGSASLVVFDRARGRPFMLNRHAGGYGRRSSLHLDITFGDEREYHEDKP